MGQIFKTSKPVIGMLHLPALPGSPRNELSKDAIRHHILKDAEALASGGVDGMILENFGDVPFYPRRVPAHTVAFMTAIALEVRRAFDIPLGINVLRNDAESALAIDVPSIHSARYAACCSNSAYGAGTRNRPSRPNFSSTLVSATNCRRAAAASGFPVVHSRHAFNAAVPGSHGASTL